MPCRSLIAPQSKQPRQKRQKVGQGDKSAFELARDARIVENGNKLAELGLGKEPAKGKNETVAIPQVQKIYCYTAQVRTSTCDHHHLTTTATR
jgi:hypothetical protein